jgi:hypothetical protein
VSDVIMVDPGGLLVGELGSLAFAAELDELGDASGAGGCDVGCGHIVQHAAIVQSASSADCCNPHTHDGVNAPRRARGWHGEMRVLADAAVRTVRA